MALGWDGCDRAVVAIADRAGGDLLAFYGGLLGTEPQRYQPGRYGEFTLPGGLVLAIFVPKPSAVPDFQGMGPGGMSLCLQVTDLQGAIARFEAAGGSVGPIQTASHGQEVYGLDPQGNRVILYQPKRPQSPSQPQG